MYLGISGIIAAGKTEFMRSLKVAYSCMTFQEPTIASEGGEPNPYLLSFYDYLQRFNESETEGQASTLARLRHVAFAMQIYLLQKRYKDHQASVWMSEQGNLVVQDRTIWEDWIFARMLNDHPDKLITDRDYKTYKDLLSSMKWTLMYPHAIIYLDVTPETALRRFTQRGRKGESITLEYLKSLHHYYQSYISDMSKRTYVCKVDWNEDNQPVTSIMDKVKSELPVFLEFVNSNCNKNFDAPPLFDPSIR